MKSKFAELAFNLYFCAVKHKNNVQKNHGQKEIERQRCASAPLIHT